MRKAIFVLSVLFLLVNTSYANTPLNSEDFYLEDVVFSNYGTNRVKLLAYFVNRSESYIKKAGFSIVLYNYLDEIIDVYQFSINSLGPGESRPIKMFFECPSKDDINDVEVKFITVLE